MLYIHQLRGNVNTFLKLLWRPGFLCGRIEAYISINEVADIFPANLEDGR